MFKQIIDWVRSRRIKETQRQMDFDALITRVWLRMEYQKHRCPVCKDHGVESFMYVRQSRIMCERKKPIRDDVGLKCPKCQHTYHVGNPMSKQDAEFEIYLRGTPYLFTPTYSRLERDDDAIKKRLEALGYGFFG